MLTAQAIEEKLVAALRAACAHVEGVAYSASWTPAEENPDALAAVSASVSTPAMPTYTAPHQTYEIAIGIGVRLELDPAGAVFLALADAVSALLARWQGEAYEQAFVALDIPGVLHCDEISADAATPVIDRDAGFHSIVFPVALSATAE